MGNPVTVLAEDTTLLVFNYFDHTNVSSCCRVNKTWKQTIDTDEVWAIVFKRIITIPKGVHAKDFIQRKIIAFHAIPSQIKKFIYRAQSNQKNRFHCSFISDPNHRLSVDFKMCDPHQNFGSNLYVVEEDRICLKRFPSGGLYSLSYKTDDDWDFGFGHCPAPELPFHDQISDTIEQRVSDYKELKKLEEYFIYSIFVALFAITVQLELQS